MQLQVGGFGQFFRFFESGSSIIAQALVVSSEGGFQFHHLIAKFADVGIRLNLCRSGSQSGLLHLAFLGQEVNGEGDSHHPCIQILQGKNVLTGIPYADLRKEVAAFYMKHCFRFFRLTPEVSGMRFGQITVRKGGIKER